MGASHARLLVAEGAKVVIGDILDDDGHALAEEQGAAAHFVHLDVTEPDWWKAAAVAAVEEFGSLNVLVNNAWIVNFGRLKTFDAAAPTEAVVPVITAGLDPLRRGR